MATAKQSLKQHKGILSRRATERIAALLLILYIVAVAVAVAARVSGGVDQETAAESVMMLAVNYGWAVAGYTAGLVAAFALTVMAALIGQVFRYHAPTLAWVSAFALLGAAFFGGLAASNGLALALEYGGGPPPQAAYLAADGGLASYIVLEPLRALAGKVGFTFSGLALLSLGGLMALTGALPRWLGALGLMVGALMFFIWYDDAAILHQVGGGLYLLWLALVAGGLLFRGTANPDGEGKGNAA